MGKNIFGLLLLLAYPAFGNAPSDFCVTYQYSEGSLPSQYHYEYRIIACANKKAQLAVVRGRPSVFDDIQRYKSEVEIKPEKIEKLYSLLSEASSENWDNRIPNQPQKVAPTGAPNCVFAVDQNSTRSVVPCNEYLIKEKYIDSRNKLIANIKDLFPESSWQEANTFVGKNIP